MNAYSAESISRTQRRYWRRTDRAASWWPWGILPLIGLLILFLFGLFKTAPAIQEQTRETVAEHLQSQGVDVRSVDVDGTRIAIDATSDQFDAAQIRAMAKGTECKTWAGQLVCPSDVEVNVHGKAAAPVVAATPQPAPGAVPEFHDFRFSSRNGDVTLSGEVANEQARSELIRQAESRFGQVIDRLTITGKTATSQYPDATVRALDTLRHVQSGTASWSGGTFSANGEVSPEREAALQSYLARSGNLPTGELSFITVRSAASCNEQFSAALAQTSINFRSGSADIQDSSAALLQRLAQLAEQCPGTLMIAGHTDSMGDAGLNLELSESRAAAVRDALIELGVVSQRLSARGYGETQPVADNGTRAGRAKNRRISIQLSENN